MRTSVSDPAGPELDTAAEGTRRISERARGSSSLSILVGSMMVTLAGVRASSSGARDAVMTIWSVTMGVTGMKDLLLTTCRHKRGMPSAPWLIPATETNDGPGQVS